MSTKLGFLAAKMFGLKSKNLVLFSDSREDLDIQKGERQPIDQLATGGRFCSSLREESGANENDPRSFSAQSVWKRIVIAGAGVVITILFWRF